MTTEVIERSTIEAIVRQRDECLRQVEEGVKLLDGALKSYNTFAKYGDLFRNGPVDRFGGVREGIDYMAGVRKQADRAAWTHILELSGMKAMMDATALEQFDKQLEADPPVFNAENIRATLIGLYQDADTIFRRGLVTAFSNLSQSKVTNQKQGIGKRIIIVRACTAVGHYSGGGRYIGGWSCYGKHDRTLDDIERVLRILDGEQALEYGRISQAVSGHLRTGRGEWWRDNPYMHLKPCMNGNLHVEFQRQDLLDKANKIIADEAGNTLRRAS